MEKRRHPWAPVELTRSSWRAERRSRDTRSTRCSWRSPIGLLLTAIAFDIVYLISDTPHWAEDVLVSIAAGVIGGLAAAIPGWIDWFGIPRGTRAKRVGLIHGVGNVVVLGLFILSWFLRRGSVSAPATQAVVAGLLAGVSWRSPAGWAASWWVGSA